MMTDRRKLVANAHKSANPRATMAMPRANGAEAP